MTSPPPVFLFFCCFFFFFTLSSLPLHVVAPPPKLAHIPDPQITVMGMVYCDICSNNSFSRHSYFMPGVEVKIDCTFKASSPKTAEQIQFSVNRTTNRFGIYRLMIPSVDGIECARENEIGNSCRASLVRSSTSACSVPASITTTQEVTVKSRSANTCIYSLSALTFRPSKKNAALCGNKH
ncbi:uncharacterized protein LOC116022759 [Ipomoea triloba]|uniref:uncharacterized protein LOC116022759 n=1 Tax=Ipomoea triloba TaxID=35885 RepID=UPI00125CEDEF|nr:uncharacterized protein LOC116022759 [Ipomoea triloba]